MMLLALAISISGVSNAFSPMMSMSYAVDTDIVDIAALALESDSATPTDTSSEMRTSHCQPEHDVQTHPAVHANDHAMPQADSNAHCKIINVMDCQSCPLSLCQISSAWLHVDQFATVLGFDDFLKSTFSSHYQAQHLAGFWQEILRPPKA